MQYEESRHEEEELLVKLVIRRQEIGTKQDSDGEFGIEPPLSNNALVKGSFMSLHTTIEDYRRYIESMVQTRIKNMRR